MEKLVILAFSLLLCWLVWQAEQEAVSQTEYIGMHTAEEISIGSNSGPFGNPPIKDLHTLITGKEEVIWFGLDDDPIYVYQRDLGRLYYNPSACSEQMGEPGSTNVLHAICTMLGDLEGHDR